MAMKDAKIKYLEHEIEEKDRVLEQLREAERPPAPPVDEGRVGTLERRVRELEAVVKGLTEELLDIKALVFKLVKTAEQREPAPAPRPGRTLPAESSSPAPTILVNPRNADKLSLSAPADVPADAEPTPETADEMDMIMQTDGTIRPEKRRKNQYIVAPNGPQHRRAGGRTVGDRSARHVDEVILAEEQEQPRPLKKR
ncbi:MAG: hypothetical protein GXY82_00235 [Methanospirillum sp.]|nr:hypothetical protein [Methanospirillum sp.]